MLSVLTSQEKGYEPEALVNFLALMGWDHHSALNIPAPHPTTTLSAEEQEKIDKATIPRADAHSLSEVFTMSQLISSFSLDHVNHRKAAVDVNKLNFINKMTLRRKANRLGKDGVLINAGKSDHDPNVVQDDAAKGKEEMVGRLQGILRETKLLEGK